MKQLVISPCLINFGDDRGGVDQAEGDIVDVTKDTARFLAENERTLYVDRKDDHTKDGRYTASEKLLAAAQAVADAKAAASAGKTKA